MSMTLEEAIKHAEAAAIENEKEAKRNREHGGWYYDSEARACAICAGEHRQLAEWLRELQERREQPEIIYCKDCTHYHTDVFGGELGLTGIWENLIVAHNACDKWTKDMNCVTPNGFCFLAGRRSDEC